MATWSLYGIIEVETEESTYLFYDELELDLCSWFEVVNLQELGLVEAIIRSQSAEERVRAFVQRHRPVGM